MSEETTTGGSGATAMRVAEATPAHRYTAELAGEIERRWQARWAEDGTFQTPNPAGPLGDPAAVAGRRKFFLLDMFPYPSGNGLHVGHPLGYIGTDVLGRFQRMNGYNVLHALGFDAFGLPAEQYAVQTGQHPRTTTERNIEIFRRQLAQLGLAHDPRRSVSTMEPEHYRWTQWIFLRIHDSWYDPDAGLGRGRARPISELVDEFASGARALPDGRLWMDLSPTQRAEVIDGHRLAYPADAPVNWCPGLGTVLSNEEVTSDGRSERGNLPVFRRNLRQWMMRITAYADRLLDDLDRLDWPESIKLMQRNWIGRSLGCRVRFATAGAPVEVFTTRPDTLFGVTFLAVAPEHPMLASLTAPVWPADVDQFWTGGALTPAEAVAAYQRQAATKSDMDRQETKVKTGVFTGSYAVNPVNGAKIPIFVADYVLMGYGTGAVMAVPGQDQRDREFATAFRLPVIRTVAVPEGFEGDVYTGDGVVVNSANNQGLDLNGLATEQAKKAVVSWLEAGGHGAGAVQYKLRDWLFSRQRYWGEPFPIVYDTDGVAHGLPESMLPVELPEVDDYTPATFDPEDADSQPCPPLSRARDWVNVELDLGDGLKTYRREVNTMPNWAGSCWYYLRYLDPTNNDTFCDPEVERYWMSAEIGEHGPADPGGVDLYVGGQEHAVLHLLYARFWHKVLHDLGEVSSEEPFRRLFNQGMIEAYAYTDERGSYVDASEVIEEDGRHLHDGAEVKRIYGKMGKSLRNVVTPDEMCDNYGADTFRLYEMSMGPLDASRPWSTKDVVGAQRFLQRLWRNLIDETTGEPRVTEAELPEDVLKALHKTIAGTRDDYQGLRFNTAAAKLIELNNLLTKTYGNTQGTPRAVAEPLVLMLAPLCPHLAEELWSRLGHTDTVAYQSYPVADERYLVEDMIEYPIQVNGRVRTKIMVPVGAERLGIQDAALSDEKIVAALEGRAPRKVIVVLGRLVNVVV